MLSWPDVEASQDWDATGMNLVIHEFAHKLDMRNGEANGCPPLPPEMAPHVWKRDDARGVRRTSRRASTAASARRSTPMRPRVPAEFFAVLSEVFFAEPLLLRHEYRRVYQQFARFYRQEPAARTELLLGRVIGSVACGLKPALRRLCGRTALFGRNALQTSSCVSMYGPPIRSRQ